MKDEILQTDIQLFGEDITEAVVVTYKMVDVDYRGLLLAEPYLGMSINESPYYPVDQVIKIREERLSRGLAI